jgi:nickel-dependent lactate racemase
MKTYKVVIESEYKPQTFRKEYKVEASTLKEAKAQAATIAKKGTRLNLVSSVKEVTEVKG